LNKQVPHHVEKAMRFEYPHLAEHAKKKHPISHKTIFYMKEYGPHSHIISTIVLQSLKVLLFAVLISSFGGLALERVKETVLSILPFVILLPALNDMAGDFGSVVASRFSAMLYEGKIVGKWMNNKELNTLLFQLIVVGVVVSMLAAIGAVIISQLHGIAISPQDALKVVGITIIDIVVLVMLIFLASIIAGIYFFKRQEDPNNFLIPIVTSIADVANIFVLCALVLFFF